MPRNVPLKASSRTKIVIALAASLMVGVLLGSTIFANVLSGTPSGSQKQGLTLSGIETLKIIGTDGKVVATWTGLDPLTPNGINYIASCVPGSNGGSITPVPFGSCNGALNQVALYYDMPGVTCNDSGLNSAANTCSFATAVPTNYLTPQACSPSTGSPSLCSGWTTEAVFAPTTFTSANCGTSCHVEVVWIGNPNANAAPFDELCTHNWANPSDPQTGVSCTLGNSAIPAVTPGETLVVSVAFTIT